MGTLRRYKKPENLKKVDSFVDKKGLNEFINNERDINSSTRRTGDDLVGDAE